MINPNLSEHLAQLRRNGCSQAALDKATLLHAGYDAIRTERLKRERKEWWIRLAALVCVSFAVGWFAVLVLA